MALPCGCLEPSQLPCEHLQACRPYVPPSPGAEHSQKPLCVVMLLLHKYVKNRVPFKWVLVLDRRIDGPGPSSHQSCWGWAPPCMSSVSNLSPVCSHLVWGEGRGVGFWNVFIAFVCLLIFSLSFCLCSCCECLFSPMHLCASLCPVYCSCATQSPSLQ